MVLNGGFDQGTTLFLLTFPTATQKIILSDTAVGPRSLEGCF